MNILNFNTIINSTRHLFKMSINNHQFAKQLSKNDQELIAKQIDISRQNVKLSVKLFANAMLNDNNRKCVEKSISIDMSNNLIISLSVLVKNVPLNILSNNNYDAVKYIIINDNKYELTTDVNKKICLINMLKPFIKFRSLFMINNIETLDFTMPTNPINLLFGNSYKIVRTGNFNCTYNSIKIGNRRMSSMINGKYLSIVIENNSRLTMIEDCKLV